MGEAGRCLLPIGVVLQLMDWSALLANIGLGGYMRGSYGGPRRFQWLRGLRAHGDVRFRCRRGDAEHAGASAECGDRNTLAE